MCGITGFVDYNKVSSRETLSLMANSMTHRGPDDFGIDFIPLKSVNIGLGHRRLSVIDLSDGGKQPQIFENYHIIHNGEIYNYKEIKDKLIFEGYEFESNSDTEVILKAFHKWKEKAVDLFIGMFVFSIYDSEKEELFIFRDRAGVKPLYYYWKEDVFIFGSELRALIVNESFKKSIDQSALALFLQYGFIPTPHSIYKNTYKLKPGHYLKMSIKEKQWVEIKYWDVFDFYNRPKIDISFDDAKKNVEELLFSAFNYRMVADVPVGMFLSGGFDSSLVAAILKNSEKQLKTFTIGFENAIYDESGHAKRVAKHLGTDHVEYICTEKDAQKIIPELPEIFDEPFGDPSAIPTTLVSRIAREHVTVSLSADGGDETFGGYEKYLQNIEYSKKIKRFFPFANKSISRLMNLIDPKNIPIYNKRYRAEIIYENVSKALKDSAFDPAFLMGVTAKRISDMQIDTLFVEKISRRKTYYNSLNNLTNQDNQISRMLAVDYKTYMLDDILVKVDRSTMSASLEGREPLLDHRIVEYTSQLPISYLINNRINKYILKDITYKYIPKEMMDRPKMGFGVPVILWMKNELSYLFKEYLSEERIKKQGIFDFDFIKEKLNGFNAGRDDYFEFLYYMFIFQLWYEKWM